MKNITGKYCTDCKVFTDNVEESALKLIEDICNVPIFKDKKIRIMPDVHSGKGIVIGFSSGIGEGVSPAHVGCDIGCRMTTMEFSDTLKPTDYELFEYRVKKEVPTGFDLCARKMGKETKHELYNFMYKEYKKARYRCGDMINDIDRIDEDYILALLDRVNMDKSKFYQSLGTLGGGNHFLEYGESDDGRGFFTIHCGSRNFGVKVFNYWDKIARSPKLSKEQLRILTEEVKKSEPDKTKWKSLLDMHKNKLKESFVEGYLYDDNLRGYLSDMVICQAYAKFNHQMIVDKVASILKKFSIKVTDVFSTTHNYIDFSDLIIRKGAIRATEGEVVIIPFNMRDGIAICRGKGNEDWNRTAPHGAGRVMSRNMAKLKLNMAEFRETMKNVYSTSVCPTTIDEAPMAYKPMDEIVNLIQPTVDVLFFIRPKINIKATDGAE